MPLLFHLSAIVQYAVVTLVGTVKGQEMLHIVSSESLVTVKLHVLVSFRTKYEVIIL